MGPATGAVRNVVLDALRRLARCDTSGDRRVVAAELATVLLVNGVAIENETLAAFFAKDPDGKRFAAWMTETRSGEGLWWNFFVCCLLEPNDKTGLEVLEPGYCYNGNFGESMSKQALCHLRLHNRWCLRTSLVEVSEEVLRARRDFFDCLHHDKGIGRCWYCGP